MIRENIRSETVKKIRLAVPKAYGSDHAQAPMDRNGVLNEAVADSYLLGKLRTVASHC